MDLMFLFTVKFAKTAVVLCELRSKALENFLCNFLKLEAGRLAFLITILCSKTSDYVNTEICVIKKIIFFY